MKDREIFSNILTTTPFILRLDGRSFHNWSKNVGYLKPYDKTLFNAMTETAKALIANSGLNASFAYTFSDEINIYINSDPFGRRIEKLDSIAAGYTSSVFTLLSHSPVPVAFDSRVIPIESTQIPSYFAWRQKEAWKNHVNGYAYKILIDSGLSNVDAQQKLNGLKINEIHELTYSHGLNLANTPTWQRRGTAIYRVSDPKTKSNSYIIDTELPLFKTKEGTKWIYNHIFE
ncbi:MAG TPA: tRNA 5'-guanylyltransferase [Methanocorpusculum sp.]|nr:tRNA 5'-guanylyltransferase [Methanocorpusculum sp.]